MVTVEMIMAKIIDGIDLGAIFESNEDEELEALCPGNVNSVNSYVTDHYYVFFIGMVRW